MIWICTWLGLTKIQKTVHGLQFTVHVKMDARFRGHDIPGAVSLSKKLLEGLFLAEDVEVMLGEAVGFVADVLEEAQGGVVGFQFQGIILIQ